MTGLYRPRKIDGTRHSKAHKFFHSEATRIMWTFHQALMTIQSWLSRLIESVKLTLVESITMTHWVWVSAWSFRKMKVLEAVPRKEILSS